MAEVARVAVHHRELMHLRDGGDHCVFVEGVGLAVHQLSPAAKCRAIHAEDDDGVAHLIEPALDRIGFCRVLIAAEFDPGLDFAAGHAGEVAEFVYQPAWFLECILAETAANLKGT